MAMLSILSGDEAGRFVALSPDRETVIGRGGFCDIVISRSTVSREHARISFSGGQYYIEDLRSINGTFVDGRQVASQIRLHDGCRINISGTAFQFLVDGAVPRAAVVSCDAPPAIASVVAAPPVPDDVRLPLLLEINRQLGSSLDVDEILPKVLDNLFSMFPHAVKGEILLLQADGDLSPRALKHGRNADSALLTMKPVGGVLARRVMDTGMPILEVDASQDDASVFSEDLRHSTLCVPMVGPSRRALGVIHLEAEDPQREFTTADQEMVTGVAFSAARAIEYARAHHEELTLDRHRRQVEAATEIQQSMLPRHRPDVPGYCFADYYKSADDIGGDYYSYARLPDGRIGIAIADVCGHGLAAALRMVELCSEVRHALETSVTVKEVMSRLNQYFCTRATFVTFMLCVLDPVRHTLALMSAGHPLPLRRSGSTGAVELMPLPNGGLPLGIMEEENYHAMQFNMEPGDLILIYTDGITEAYDKQQDLFGEEKLIDCIQKAPGRANQVIDSLVRDLAEFRGDQPQSDDLCVVAFGRDVLSPDA